jgi:hypothetical protein
MAYLEDDFNDDDLQVVEIADEELNAVFAVTEDGEEWDDEEGLDDGWADEDGGFEDWDDENPYIEYDDDDFADDEDVGDDGDDSELDDLLNDDSFFDRVDEVYKELRDMGFMD